MRWLLTGSVGFHHIMRRLGRVDLLNDAENVDLGPLAPEWARWLAACLLLGAGVASPRDDVVEELADASGGIAFLLHLAAKEVRDRQLTALMPGEVTQLLDGAVGDVDRGHQMTAFLTRLSRHYGQDERLAAWLLDQLVQGPHDRSQLAARAEHAGIEVGSDGRLRTVPDWLRADHYLDATVVDGVRRYGWRYPALRRIWVLRRL